MILNKSSKEVIMDIKNLRQYLEQKKGQKKLLEAELAKLKQEIRELSVEGRRHEKALEIVKLVGLKTQQQFQYHISDITSIALESVFPEPYELAVNFIENRNNSECNISFVKDSNSFDPLESSGYGVADIASFALRIASWSLMNPKSINTIILDEPFKFVSAEYQETASAMIKELSEKLNLQFIIVTHNEILTSYADKEFKVSIKNGISKIR